MRLSVARNFFKDRANCTLFYVDSTYAGPRPLNPDVFKAVADAYPDVLLIPENESMRYFAYSMPKYLERMCETCPRPDRRNSLDCFLRTKMDVLVLGAFVIERNGRV
jgi:hypothetical protein